MNKETFFNYIEKDYILKFFLYLLFTLLLLTSCSNNDKKSTQPFSITMSSGLAPAFTSKVPVNARIILDVNETLDPATVNETNVYIQETNTTIHHPTSVTLLTLQITLQPVVHFKANTNYEVVVTTGVQTTDGISLSEDVVISFLTDGTVDSLEPVFLSSLPKNNALNVQPFSHIIFEFNEPLSPLTIDASTISVFNTDLMPILGKIETTGSIISFIPLSDLTEGNYTVSVDESTISDLAGNLALSVNDINFTVAKSKTLIDLASFYNTNTYNVGATINNLNSVDDIIFVGSENGLFIIQHNTPEDNNTNFTLRSHLSSDALGSVYDVDAHLTSGRAYIGSSKGVSIFDITDLDAPSLLSFYPTTYPVYGIDANETNLYAAASLQGFIGLDISDELSPKLLFTRPTTSTAFDVKIYDYNGQGLILSDYADGIVKATIDGNTSEASSTSSPIRQLADSSNTYSLYAAGGITGTYSIDFLSTLSVGPYNPPSSYTMQVCYGINSGMRHSIERNVGINDHQSNYYNSSQDLISLTCIESKNDLGITFVVTAERSGKLSTLQTSGY